MITGDIPDLEKKDKADSESDKEMNKWLSLMGSLLHDTVALSGEYLHPAGRPALIR